jgi:AmiR/NasT family two-component response regulator
MTNTIDRERPSLPESDPDRTEERLRERIANLEIALVHRDVIGQAKGVIMAVQGATSDEAFALLVSASQREGVRVFEVASRIVDGLPARHRRR